MSSPAEPLMEDTVEDPLLGDADADDDVPLVQAVAVPEEKQVEITAPSNLNAGYELTVDVEGGTVIVCVPPGGVRQGEVFQATIIEREDPHNIPTGHWRDGCFDCCIHGCCHPVCCWTFCFPAVGIPIVLAQVMTRLQLGPWGNPATNNSMSPYKVMVLIILAELVFEYVCAGLLHDYSDYKSQTTREPWVVCLLILQNTVRVTIGLYVLILMTKTRAFIRRKYQIQEQVCCCSYCCCSEVQDCCCSYWLAPCTVAQMARHTADYRTYRASCCSETGLSERAPHVV